MVSIVLEFELSWGGGVFEGKDDRGAGIGIGFAFAALIVSRICRMGLTRTSTRSTVSGCPISASSSIFLRT